MPEETQDSLASARAALAAIDAKLAAADDLLGATMRDAHRVAAEATRRLGAIQAEIDSAVARRSTTSPASGQEFGRYLLARNREISQIVTAARADAEAKAVAVQALAAEYRSAAGA